MHPELRPRRPAGAGRCRGTQSRSCRRDAGAVVPRGPARRRCCWSGRCRRSERCGGSRSGRDGDSSVNVLAVGMSHRTATVRELERAAVSPRETGKLLAELLDCPNLNEVVLLSTCNRVEVYAVVDTFHGGLADVTGVL